MSSPCVPLSRTCGGVVVATECARDLTRADRAAAGKTGGIVQIVYVSAVVPEVGKSLREMIYARLEVGNPSHGLTDCRQNVCAYWLIQGEYFVLDIKASAKALFSDLPLEKGIKLISQAPRHSAPSFAGKLTYPAYRHVSVAYIVCERDLVIPAEYQRRWIERMERETGRTVRTIALDAGHSPHASMPGEMAKVVQSVLSV